SRVAINRTVAGVHFPVDSAAGQLLGTTLGEYFVHRASTPAANYSSRQFNCATFPAANDFVWHLVYDAPGDRWQPAQPAWIGAPISNAETAGQSPLLNWLWTQAAGEWP
ncbi:MAG TPA: hypothetical protein VFZ51_10375, partial [Woeseiaceae bacterium]